MKSKSFMKEKEKRVFEYVAHKNPFYRSLLKYNPEIINNIQLHKDDDKLDIELFRLHFDFRSKLKQEQTEFLKSNLDNINNYDEYIKKREDYLKKMTSVGKDELAQYIMHRKIILELLSLNLSYVDDQKKKYAFERDIHNIIFPMIKTSDDIDYKNHNLWIIDEKLAYHYYLTSDKKLSSNEILETNSNLEPDLVIFELAFALTGDSNDEEINNITIIEFKRPGTVDKNCVNQVISYIKKIRTGKFKDKDGRVISGLNPLNIRFTCYIICDINSELIEVLEDQNFRKTPDQKGYFLPHDNHNAYFEIIDYGKLISDSKKRNKILFDTLMNQLPE